MTGRIGVPGVRVYEVRAANILCHLQINPQSRERRVGRYELRGHKVRVDICFVAWLPEAPNYYLQRRTQSTHKLCNVNSGATVDFWRILTGK